MSVIQWLLFLLLTVTVLCLCLHDSCDGLVLNCAFILDCELVGGSPERAPGSAPSQRMLRRSLMGHRGTLET